MRSSKSRSRSKSNRNRSMGNIVNRVFDSSGPEGKVRGTPQQIIDKYNQLARDAQLANDRVAFENFQQHAEHYTRMLSEAMREQEAFRAQQQDRQGDRDDRREQQSDQQPDQQPRSERREDRREERRDDRDRDRGQQAERSMPADVIDTTAGDAESGLVETPESAAPKPRRARRPKKSDQPVETGSDTAEAAE